MKISDHFSFAFFGYGLVFFALLSVLFYVLVTDGFVGSSDGAVDGHVSPPPTITVLIESEQESAFENSVVAEEEMHVEPEALLKAGYIPVAVVVSGVGLSEHESEFIKDEMPSRVTVDLSPYALHFEEVKHSFIHNGNEVWLSIPLDPSDFTKVDTGPLTIKCDSDDEEIKRNTDILLNMADGGVKGFIGTRDTHIYNAKLVAADVLKKIFSSGFYYMDSSEFLNFIPEKLAFSYNSVYLNPDIWLDDVVSEEYIRDRIERFKRLAKKQGYGLAFVHANLKSLDVVNEWLGELEHDGFVLVPVSELNNKINGTDE